MFVFSRPLQVLGNTTFDPWTQPTSSYSWEERAVILVLSSFYPINVDPVVYLRLLDICVFNGLCIVVNSRAEISIVAITPMPLIIVAMAMVVMVAVIIMIMAFQFAYREVLWTDNDNLKRQNVERLEVGWKKYFKNDVKEKKMFTSPHLHVHVKMTRVSQMITAMYKV